MQKKDLIQLGVTGVLVVILIFALSNAFKKTNQRSLKKVSFGAVVLSKTAPGQPISQSENSKGLYDRLEQQAKSIELKRDPFTAAPITSEKSLQSGIDLTGILWDKDKPLAIINGEIVKKGARVGNRIVIDIKKDRVLLSDGEILTEIKLE